MTTFHTEVCRTGATVLCSMDSNAPVLRAAAGIQYLIRRALQTDLSDYRPAICRALITMRCRHCSGSTMGSNFAGPKKRVSSLRYLIGRCGDIRENKKYTGQQTRHKIYFVWPLVPKSGLKVQVVLPYLTFTVLRSHRRVRREDKKRAQIAAALDLTLSCATSLV